MNNKINVLTDYWAKEAEKYVSPTPFPLQKSSFSTEQSDSGKVYLHIPFDRYGEIKKKIDDLGITLFAFLSGITIIELMSLKDVKKYSYAYPVDMTNRSKDGEVNAKLNTMINTICLNENESIKQYFTSVQKKISNNLQHSYVDYLHFSEKFSNEGKPLFDTLLNYDYKVRSNFFDSDEVQVNTIDSQKTRVPIEFYFLEDKHSIDIKILFDKFNFDKSYIDLMKFNINKAITNFLDNELDNNVLNLIGQEIKFENQENVIDNNSFKHVLQSISENVASMPAKAAIEYGDQVISYGKLWDDVTSLAFDIYKKAKDSRPKIIIDGARNYETIVNILASWIVKAIVVPVDNTQPIERIKAIIQACEPSYVLGNSNNLGRKLGIEMITKTGLGKYDISHYSSQDDAYIYFTSGTTGKPKGILGWHGALANFIHWESQLISDEDRFMQLTKPFFDVYLRDILSPLVVGATIVIPNDDEVLIAQQANKFINEKNISALHIVPTLANLWVAEKNYISDKKIKVFFAGEPLTMEFLENWFLSFENARVTNLYGPTEGTLAKFAYTFDASTFRKEKNISVGTPIKAANYYIARSDGSTWYKLGKYEVGTIIIESNYLSKGYLGSENNRTFISNSMYNTGDLGYTDDENLLHLVGRSDDQIKIDGVRIQPNEITEVIMKLQEIDWAMVTINKENKNLSAYLMSKQGNINVEEIIEYLSVNLPTQFIPTDYYQIDKLEMKLNGKVDRQKIILNGKLLSTKHRSQNIEEKSNDSVLEKLLEKIFESELRINKITSQENFFKLGGNSLKAAKTIGAINSLLHVKLSYKNFLSNSTPEGLERSLTLMVTNDKNLNKQAKTILEKLK